MTTASSPVIGIVGAGHAVPRFWGELAVTGTPTSYVDAVLAAGGMPVVVPGRAPDRILDLVDALVLTGGGDVDPARYDGDPSTATEVDLARDEAELRLAHAAAARGRPVLGICRGLQVLVVAFGGRLGGLGDVARAAHDRAPGRRSPPGRSWRAGSDAPPSSRPSTTRRSRSRVAAGR